MNFVFAEFLDPASVFKDLQKPSPGRGGLGVLFLAVGAIVLCFLVWAIFIRKRRDERARRYSYGSSSRSSGSSVNGAGREISDGSGRSGKRRRRRRHRRVNPTLAETGGLPPPRTDMPSGDPP
jgi:hypothetical protein